MAYVEEEFTEEQEEQEGENFKEEKRITYVQNFNTLNIYLTQISMKIVAMMRPISCCRR